MVDSGVFWRRFGPALYWDEAVAHARRSGSLDACLRTVESSRVSGVDWRRLSLGRTFSLQTYVDVGRRRFEATPRTLIARGAHRGGVRVDLERPVDVLVRVLDYMDCVSEASEYLAACGLRVRREHGALGPYVRRYVLAYPYCNQHQAL